jgi:thiol-disulfide isomerase/thioredoxin
MSDYARTPKQRLLALAGLIAIVGAVIGVLFVVGLVGNQGEGEAVALVDTPPAEGQGLDVGPEAGKLAPDFEISDYDGDRYRLSDFRGQIVYLNFWATWCVPCRDELPDIALLDEENDDLVVITVARREPIGDARGFFDSLPNLQGEEGVTFDVNGLDPDDTLFERYRGIGMPTSIIIGPDGVVSRRADGQISLDDMREAVAAARGTGVSHS